MARRFTYSRWDGTQRGFDLDGDVLLEQVTDEIIHHGDVSAALRRLMEQGMRTPDGRSMPGLAEMRERLRRRREEISESGDLDGPLADAARELADILDEERHAVDRALSDAERSGDERRESTARAAAAERSARLDLLPDDLAGRMAELSSYSFESAEAQRRFDELADRLRSEMLQQVVDRVTEDMSSATPEDMSRVKDMLAALNEMVDRRDAGEDPQFEEFMDRFGDMFPDDPQSLDELLESIARRMAAAQALMNSMSPEQRDQLRRLSEQFMSDMDLQWQLDRLSSTLRGEFGSMNWDASYEMEGDGSLSLGEGIDAMAEMGRLDELEGLLDAATSPADLAEIDPERVRDLIGDDAAAALDQLAKLTEELIRAGLVDRVEGRLELTPRGLRAIGSNALRDLFGSLRRDQLGQHPLPTIGQGHESAHDTKPYEFGDPFRLDLHRTIRNAIARRGGGTPVELEPDDFEVERTEHLTRAATVLMVDLSMSMPMRGNFLPAKKVAIALHSLITSQFPHDFIGLVGFSETAREITAAQLPEVSWDYVYGTNMHHGFTLARRMLSRQQGTKQIIMITDGEPTAHITSNGGVFFDYPPAPETLEATLREVVRCTREGIRINTFVLDATASLDAFVERMTNLNGGRAFHTTNDELGGYVLVDFVERRRRLTRRRAG
ncbi:MAG: vWA domain-containing protein [Ilumatobacteraceae bacterium]